jgi:hypothetical protein
MNDTMGWRKKGHHKGLFDDFTVTGFKLENAGGETGWHITAWRTDLAPDHDYWVAGQDFYSAILHIFYKGSPTNHIEIIHPHINDRIDPAERKAVHRAIAEWEKPTADA